MADKDAKADNTDRGRQAGAEKERDGKENGNKERGNSQDRITAKNTTREDDKFLKENQEGLSKTAKRARWVHSLDEHEDHPGETLATRSREVIQQWAEQRKAVPATVRRAEGQQEEQVRVLRFNFPGYGGDKLEEISWEEWFAPFDERQLVFLFQEHKSDGVQSNFFILDSPEREDG